MYTYTFKVSFNKGRRGDTTAIEAVILRESGAQDEAYEIASARWGHMGGAIINLVNVSREEATA